MKNKNKRRVVVTGLGVVSSIGIGWQEFWKNLIAGKSGISKVESFDTSQYARHYGGEVKNFDPHKYMTKRRAASMGRSSQMAVAAAKMAVEDAGLVITKENREKIAVIIGMTMAEMGVLESANDEVFEIERQDQEKLGVQSFPARNVASNVSKCLGARGRSLALPEACASGNYSVGYATDLIRSGKCDYVFAGGADRFSRIVFTGFGRLLSIAPEKCQPFDKNRKGMIPGEGAGILFLEALESAQARNTQIYAEVLGYGLSCDAGHMTIPGPTGVTKAIKKSLLDSNVSADEIDYICAHGTGTQENDKVECESFQAVFGEKLKEIPVSSIKSMLGHTLGAAAAIEAIACCLAVKEGMIPPTINYQEPDPLCDVDCVPNQSRGQKVNVVVNNALAFGGNNGCTLLVKEDSSVG